MNTSIIGPSYQFVRNDIYTRIISALNISNTFNHKTLKHSIKNIINKHIPQTNCIITYGNWGYYKKNGISIMLKKNILLEIYQNCIACE